MKKQIILFFTFLTLNLIHSKPTKMIFIEQIYKLYESNLYLDQTDHKRNIFWLENALKLPNIHPSMAIVVTKTWEEYVKYKTLLRFHIHFLLTQEYMAWAWQYDKKDVVFYNIEWNEELKKSFEIARFLYEKARYYWSETKKWSKFAYEKKVNIGWDEIEDLNWKIENKKFEYDYDEVIDVRLKSLDEKLKKIDEFLNKK